MEADVQGFDASVDPVVMDRIAVMISVPYAVLERMNLETDQLEPEERVIM